jgi:hypothetical protein
VLDFWSYRVHNNGIMKKQTIKGENMRVSNWANVGQTITWTSAAGVTTGEVLSIDAGKPTAHPTIKADYYLIGYAKWPSGNWKTAYLNSNMMKQLKVEVTSNQLELF